MIHNLQCWQRRRSTPSRAADMAKPRPLVAVAYPHFRGMICASHDSSKSQDPLSHHAATLTIRRDPFAQPMPRIPRTGQLARYFGTITTIFPTLTIPPFLVGHQVREIIKATRRLIHALTWRRHEERFIIGDLEDFLYRTPYARVAFYHGRLPATQILCGSKPQYSWTDASFEASQR